MWGDGKGSIKDHLLVLVPSWTKQLQGPRSHPLCTEPCNVLKAVELAFSQALEMTTHVSSQTCPEVSLLVLGTSLRAVEEPKKGSLNETKKSTWPASVSFLGRGMDELGPVGKATSTSGCSPRLNVLSAETPMLDTQPWRKQEHNMHLLNKPVNE